MIVVNIAIPPSYVPVDDCVCSAQRVEKIGQSVCIGAHFRLVFEQRMTAPDDLTTLFGEKDVMISADSGVA